MFNKKIEEFLFLNIFELIFVNSMKDKTKVIKITYKYNVFDINIINIIKINNVPVINLFFNSEFN